MSIVNLSFGREGSCDAPERDLAAALAARGIWLVAPTGNQAGAVMSPASCPEVVAVGAHGPGEARPVAAYSAMTGDVDLVAPGGDLGVEDGGVLSLSGAGRNGYVRREGTSLAAAHVSGALSVLTAAFPDLTRRQVLEVLQQGGAACDGCGAVPALDLEAAMNLAAVAPKLAPVDAPCGAEQACDDGLVCAASPGSPALCRQTCGASTGDGCPAAHNCLPLDGALGEAVCLPAGPIVAGGPCQMPADCAAGNVCVMDPALGLGVCQPQCNHGYTCPDASTECVALNPFQSYCKPEAQTPPPVDEPPPATMPPPASGLEEGRCHLTLGNMDCAEGEGCLEDHDGDDVGFCGPWSGVSAGGARCDDRYSCGFGLCEAGVCLYPCTEGGCAAGWACSADAVCRPAGCSGGGDCGEGFSCEEVDGAKQCVMPDGGCTALGPTPDDATPPWGAALLFGLLWLRGRSARGDEDA